MRIAHILLLSAALAISLSAQAPEPVSVVKIERVEDVYLARDDGAGKAGDVTNTFSPGDIPIHCIVVLTASEPTAVKMHLVAVKVGGVKPESRVVTSSFNTTRGHDRVFFTGRPHGTWAAGSYRIDIFVEGKLEKSIGFDVKGGAIPLAASTFVQYKPKPKTPRKKN